MLRISLRCREAEEGEPGQPPKYQMRKPKYQIHQTSGIKYTKCKIQIQQIRNTTRWDGVWVRGGGKPGSSSPARPTLSPAFPVWCGKDDKYMEYKYTNTKEVYRRSITASAISQSVYPEPNLIIFSPCDKQSVILNSLNWIKEQNKRCQYVEN